MKKKRSYKWIQGVRGEEIQEQDREVEGARTSRATQPRRVQRRYEGGGIPRGWGGFDVHVYEKLKLARRQRLGSKRGKSD